MQTGDDSDDLDAEKTMEQNENKKPDAQQLKINGNEESSDDDEETQNFGQSKKI